MVSISRDTAVLFESGIANLNAGRYAQAAEVFRNVLKRVPAFAPGHNALGLAYAGLERRDDALSSYEAALRADPALAAAYINRATLRRDIGQLRQARTDLDRAVALQPHEPAAHGNRASLLMELGEPGEAIASFERALTLKPNYPHAAGLRLISKAYICDWSGMDGDLAALEAGLRAGAPVSPPWPLLALLDDPGLQRRAAEAWIAARFPNRENRTAPPPYRNHDRIRIGYYSADFHRHPTGHLIAGLFERHDRSRFEVFAFSLRPVRDDDMHRRLSAGVDRFTDVRDMSDSAVAALSRDLEIDIAVDLNGLISNNRIGIFSHRAAPVQVNYLGYPGTLGADFIDYILADATVIAEPRDYAERVMFLPDCYQVNDAQRHVADRLFSRSELGLPETAFVFCCFNNNYKITPHVFDVWMRILRAVPKSVLWLIEDSAAASANLRREAARRAVDPSRLVFAPRIAQEEHLARQKSADLFLDTYPYNAHTTGSDALWMGLPLITRPGKSFASRVAASLLRSIGMPDLIVPTFGDYEALAVAMAQDPGRLAEIKRRLATQRPASRLFDLERFTRGIEAAFQDMIASKVGA